jgi:hypothetical protein
MDYLKMAAIAGVLVVGTLAFAVLARNVHLWWIEQQERKDRERMEERYWQEMTDEALDEADAILKEIQR